MSQIEEKDILRFLEGRSNDAQKQEVLSWSKANIDNKRALKVCKKIHREAPNLDSFNLVDESQEWNAFLKSTSPEMSDLQILNHLDGYSSYSEKKEISKWEEKSEENRRDLKIYNLILREAPKLANTSPVNPEVEWDSFKTKTQANSIEAKVTPLHTPEAKNRISKIFPMWQRFAAAAAVAVLLVAIYTFRPQENYLEYATQDQKHTIMMEDGSEIELAQYSTLRYPRRLKNMSERRLYLNGEAMFNVVENKEKPFIVEVNDVIGVEVLGTIFKVNNHDEFIEVVENIEGRVKAFALTKPGEGIVLEKGDKFGFDGLGFVDMKIEPEVLSIGTEYEIIHILDYLMETSDWKVITSPYTEFEEKGIVKVDLDQPIEKILEDLVQRADFEYDPLGCEGCFIIRKFETFKS